MIMARRRGQMAREAFSQTSLPTRTKCMGMPAVYLRARNVVSTLDRRTAAARARRRSGTASRAGPFGPAG